MTETPAFWQTTLEEISHTFLEAQKAEKRILAFSAGNRPLYCLSYGEKDISPCNANYSSALGAHDKACYKPKDAKPTLLLIGAEHGQETEGVAGLMNLISLMETGRDLAGNPNEALPEAASKIRLVILPVANPDGRARVEPKGIVGMTGYDLRYWGQGTWKDGSLCGWPDCKKIHPIKGHEGFLGGYYNDDGINLMHDNFFHPMAKETQAILDLCAAERPDMILHLHGGSNSEGNLLQTAYVPPEISAAIEALAKRCIEAGKPEGLVFAEAPLPPAEETPPSFNLPSAAHHVCGAISAVYESNECLIDEPGPHLSHAQITRMHLILFEQAMKMLCEGR